MAKNTTATKEELYAKVSDTEAPSYDPSDAQKSRIQFVMDEYQDMMTKRKQSYPQFNDRTLLEFIDDSEKRMNAYVLDKSSQGKEEWQANFATRAYANKAKALLAATARDIPDMKFKAVNSSDNFDYFAAELMKDLVRYSYYKGNPQVDLFYLGWSLITRGTVISYEGFQQHQYTKKKIKSFDLITGDIDFEEVEERSYGEPVSFEIPLQNLLIKNFYISDIQEQPSIIWWTYYAEKERFDAEWGKYPNAKYVKDLNSIVPDENKTYFTDTWKEQCEKGKGYLLMRYMNKYTDTYRVIANGVELYNGAMLWENVVEKGRKCYPLAKEIFEPFATGRFFFYGNSMPNSAMGEGDVINTLINTSLDKTYRSMVPPLLIGMTNKDLLDLEDEIVAGDTKIYVDDIAQVKQMEIKGISDSDIKMIQIISSGFDMTTLDPSQQGAAEKYVTARAAVAADERARQLKGLFFMFLESLWLQKTRLRIANILLSYTKPQYMEIAGEDGEKLQQAIFRTFNVEDTELSDGSRGTLSIKLAGSTEELQQLKPEIEEEEGKQKALGNPYEKIAVKYDYLERFAFDVQIIPATIWQSSQALAMAMVLEKTATIAKLFPQFFQVNQASLVRDILEKYDDDPSKYQFPEMPPQDPNAEEGEGAGGTGGVASDITGVDGNNGLGKITGVEQ